MAGEREAVAGPLAAEGAQAHALHGRVARRALAVIFVLVAGSLLLSGCMNGDASSTGIIGKAGSLSAGTWDGEDRPTLLKTLGDPRTSGLGKSWPASFDVAPTAFDLDGDGRDEVIAQGNDTFVHVFDSASGRVLARLPTTTPAHWYIERVLNEVAAGVLVPDKPASLIVVNHAAYVTRWDYVAAGSTDDAMQLNKTWELRLNKCHNQPSMDSGAVLADVTGDGTQEIFVQTEENGMYALRPDGVILWKRCDGGGNAAPVIDDLDGDGLLEVIFATDSGVVQVYHAATGAPVWRFDITQHDIWPGSISLSPTVGDLDGYWPKEVLFTARYAWNDDPATFPKMHMAVAAVRGDGMGSSELVWLVQPEWANPTSYTRLVVLDADGDGSTDVFGMDWNTIGHYPGNWERFNESHVFRLDAQGNEVWNYTIDSWWSNKAIQVLDADGDGVMEVLANGPLLGVDGIYRLSVATGEREGFLGVPGWKLLRGPAIADIRNDGGTQLLLAMEPLEPAKPRGGIFVIDLEGAKV